MSKIFILTAVAVLFITPTWGLSVSDINSGTYWVNPEEAGFDDCLDLNYETGESYGSYVPSSTCRSNWSKWIKERTQYSSLTGNGSITYYWPILKVECPINDEIHCETTYDRTNSEAAITVCASGYYGNGKTCTKCPANASCSGEGNTTFTCNSGYCNTGTACVARPAIPPVVAQHSNVMPDITKVVLCVKNARMAEQVLRAQRRNRNVLFTRVRRKAT